MRQIQAANVGSKHRQQNIGGKCRRQMLAAKLCGIVKLLRYIIYDRNKADVEISAPIKIYAPKLFVHQKIGAQALRLLTIWARQNLQLLTSSMSGWRALVQVMLPLVHVVLKWLEHSSCQLIWVVSLPYCTGCCTGTTCQNICALSKYLRAHIFSPFTGEKSKIYLGL